MRRRTVLTALLVWTLVVAAVSAVTWAVIDAAGRELFVGDGLVTDAAPAVSAATTGATEATRSPSPGEQRSRSPRAGPVERSTPPASPTASPRSASPAPSGTTTATGQSRTWEGPPGVVSVRCEGARISLRSASPNNGYRIEVEKSSEEIEVHFKSSSREYQVKARCSGGTPRFGVESSVEDEGDD